METGNRHAIAERLRGLIAGQDAGDLGQTAHRLGVEEVSLRMSIDEVSPFPTLDVLMAVVKHYGVDPTYLVSGKYDGATHRSALGDPQALGATIRGMIHDTPRPVSDPPQERPHLHIA